VSDQPNLERSVPQIDTQVQLLNVSVLELLIKPNIGGGRAREAEESPFVLIVV
jgi:hypothetical protein